MKKILIIEDEEGIRRLLQYDLKQANYDVQSAKDGQEAFDILENHEFDAIVVDWMLPVYDGISIVKMLRSKNMQSIILMLTAKDEESNMLEAFEAGVDDYLTKPFSPRVLTARLEAHLKRTASTTSNTQTFGNLIIHLGKHVVEVEDVAINLTKKEFDVLVYLTRNLDLVVSRDQILSDIWDFEYDGDSRIVDVHIFNLRQKLEHSDLKIESVRGVGYIAKV